MSKLRSRDALRREAESDRRAVEARAELETRIGEAMDRWTNQARARAWLESEQGIILGSMAAGVYERYGATLV